MRLKQGNRGLCSFSRPVSCSACRKMHPTDGKPSVGWRRFEREALALLVVVQQAEDVVLGEAIAAFEKIKLNGEGQAGNFAA